MGSHKKKKKSDVDSSSPHKNLLKKKKHKQISHKKEISKRRRHESTSSSDSSSSASNPGVNNSELKKRKKRCKYNKKDKCNSKNIESSDIPINLMEKRKSMAPMTKEQWEKQQSVLRVFDESTGRYRLIKGEGEVIEEIVNKTRHKEINQQATQGDGNFFQSQMFGTLKKH